MPTIAALAADRGARALSAPAARRIAADIVALSAALVAEVALPGCRHPRPMTGRGCRTRGRGGFAPALEDRLWFRARGGAGHSPTAIQRHDWR